MQTRSHVKGAGTVAGIRRRLGLWTVALLAGQAFGADSMIVGERFRDFGRVAPQSRMHWEVVLTNRGGEPLKITGVKASCSCFVPDWREATIPPGGQRPLRLELIASEVSGPIEEELRFQTSDPTEAQVSLSVRAEVYRAIEALPAFVMLPVTPDSWEQESATVRIVNHEAEPAPLGDPVSRHPAFAARLTPVRSGFEYLLEVRLVKPLPNGNHYGRIELPTPLPSLPRVEVTAFVPGLSSVVAGPRALRFPATNGTESRPVFLRSTTDRLVKVGITGAPPAGLTLKLEEREPGRLFRLTAAVASDFPRPKDPLQVELATDHPSHPVLRIPVVFEPSPSRPVSERP